MRRIVISIFIIHLTVLSLLSLLWAEEEQPRITDARVGFLSFFKNGSWTPLEAEIKNPGEEFEGEVIVRSPVEGGALNVLFSQHIFVPANCKRRFYFPVKFAVSTPLEVVTEETKKFKKISFQIQLFKGSTLINQGTFFAHPVPSECYTMLIVDSQPGYYGFLRGMEVDKEKRPLQRLFLRETGNLPDRIPAYDGIDAIWLNNFLPLSLRPLQEEALREWLISGGLLIIHPQEEVPFLEDYFPVEVVGSRKIDTLPVLRGKSADNLYWEEGLSIRESFLQQGEINLAEKNLPLVASRDVGLGKLVFIAFDSAGEIFGEWAGSPKLWREILNLQETFFPGGEQALSRSREECLNQLAGIRVPAKKWIAIYFGGVILLIFGTLLVFRRKEYSEFAWVVVIGISLVFTLLIHFLSLTWRGTPPFSINETYLARSTNQSSNYKINSCLGVFSPTTQKYDIRFSNSTAKVFFLKGQKGTVLETEYADLPQISDFKIYQNSLGDFCTESLENFKGRIEGEIVLNEKGIEGFIHNQLPFKLEDAFFKYNRLVLNLGNLNPRERKEIRYRDKKLDIGAVRYSSKEVRGRIDGIRQAIRRSFFPDPLLLTSREITPQELLSGKHTPMLETPAFFAWGREAGVNLDIPALQDADILRQSVGLLAVQVPLKIESGKVFLPQGILPLQVIGGSSLFHKGEGFFTGTMPFPFSVKFSLPKGLKEMKIKKAILFTNFHSSVYFLEVSVTPFSSPLGQEFDYLGNRTVMEIPSPEKYFANESRSIVVQLKPTYLGEEEEEVEMELPDADDIWQIRGLDLEIEGEIP